MEAAIRSSFLISLFFLLLLIACEERVTPIDVSYEANIQESIFNLSCLTGCHDGARQAGLELTTWETLMEGGDIRLVIVPGNAEESPLVWSIEGQDAIGVPVSLMPPTGLGFPPLSGADIRLIKDWIDQGAKNN